MKLQTSGVLGTSYAIAKLAPKRPISHSLRFGFVPGTKFTMPMVYPYFKKVLAK